jgi:centromere/kinetochore protein ZW10
LNKSKYYTAIGMVTDAALSRVLEDVLALPDIPEVESHRLSELCRILHGLEALFVEEANQARTLPQWIEMNQLNGLLQDPFVVAYVPSWLKFSYLSELLVRTLPPLVSRHIYALACSAGGVHGRHLVPLRQRRFGGLSGG